MLDHLSVQCADIGASSAFYDRVLAPLGVTRAMDFGEVIGYGVGGKPEFWVGRLVSGEPNREVHIAFSAKDREREGVFRRSGLVRGHCVVRTSGLLEYHENYYGAFVRDPEGNNVEAVCHLPE